MRIKTHLVLLIIAGVVLCGACRKSTPNQNSNSNATTSVPETLGGGAAPAGEKLNFRGAIANLSIEMNLVREGERLSGTYFYPRVGKNIDLKGEIDKDNNVNLRETDETGKETGVFKGKWKSNAMGLAEIDGKWSRPDGSKETGFLISQQPVEFTAAVRVVPKVIRENNKEAKYSVDAEYPQIEGDARFAKFNAAARAMITKDVAAFKTGETASEEDEMDLPEETGTSSLDIGYQIRLATDDLVSIEFTQGQYSRGAAHGNSITAVLNFDVKNGKKLALADLFNANSKYLSVISDYCIKDLKEQSKRDKESMLEDEQIQDGAAARADNYQAWTITRKGLLIVFDPYQVAAYAAGPQQVMVPYSALKPIVKTDGPIASLAG
jgi:uncharacterized protein DUF3298/peptidoglycan-N-acetylmuramic acid deacetylase PdaC-like protein